MDNENRAKAVHIIEQLTIEQLYQYFNNVEYLRDCMVAQFDNAHVSLEYLQNLKD